MHARTVRAFAGFASPWPGQYTRRMRYIIFGAGGIGGVIGARLHQQGCPVVLIARGAHADLIERDGLELVAPEGRVRLCIPLARHPGELDIGDDDVVVLAMKSQHTSGALDDLRLATAVEPAVVCAQNGVANERMALRRFARVYGMLVHLPATHLEPGQVVTHAAGRGGILDTGRFPSGSDDVCRTMTGDLERAGFSARPDSSVMRWKYAKLLTNLGNALQAAVVPDGAGNGALGDAGRELMRRLKHEALACFSAAGIDCASRDEVRTRQAGVYRLGEVPGQPRGGGSSWQSLVRGTGNLETDYLNGEVVLLGRLHGVATPANALCQSLARRLLRERLPAGSFDAAEMLAMLPTASSSGS
jgi:2-dehydropantoate 2-reductase